MSDIKMSDEDIKDGQIKFLWSLLDDISTAGDMFKPEINGYFKHINSICEKRSEVANSLDGYSLTINNHDPMALRIKELEAALGVVSDRANRGTQECKHDGYGLACDVLDIAEEALKESE